MNTTHSSVTIDSPAPAGYKDRHAGLIIFGILIVLLGAVCALLVPVMMLSLALPTPPGVPETSLREMLPGMILYLGLAVMFVWLGIGSIRCRRWARALLLVFGWIWLIIGVFSSILVAILLPRMMASTATAGVEMPEAVRWITVVIVLAFIFLIYVVLPGILVLFYQSRHVKATCEARDPVRRWTDACPLPVLAVCIMMAAGGFSMLGMLLAYRSVMPFFGMLWTGWPALLLILGLAGLFLWLAYAFYRLQPTGWWVAVATLGTLAISNVLTFARIDLMEMYRKMGFRPEQLEMFEQMGFLLPGMIAGIIGFTLAYLGYIIWLRRYFFRPAETKGGSAPREPIAVPPNAETTDGASPDAQPTGRSEHGHP